MFKNQIISFMYQSLLIALFITAPVRTLVVQLIWLPIFIANKNWNAIEIDWGVMNIYKRFAFGVSSYMSLLIFSFTTKDFAFKSLHHFIMFNRAWDKAYLNYIIKVATINMSKLSFKEKKEVGSILDDELAKELDLIGFYNED